MPKGTQHVTLHQAEAAAPRQLWDGLARRPARTSEGERAKLKNSPPPAAPRSSCPDLRAAGTRTGKRGSGQLRACEPAATREQPAVQTKGRNEQS